jgi:IPT/TIG domain-containing protein
MRTPKISTKRAFGLTLAATLAVTGTVAFASSSQAAVGKVTATPASGPELTAGKVVTLTGTGFRVGTTNKVATAALDGVQFSIATCTAGVTAADPAAVIQASARTVVSATKMVVTVPSLPAAAVAGATQKWNICVYDTQGNGGSGTGTQALLSSGTYSSLPAPTISAANSPASGSVAGGDTVTVTGTGFTKATKVKFGSVLSSKVTVATDGTTLTAVAPSAPAGAVAVSVTTEGGTNATPGTASFDDYTYKNAIVVSPNVGDGSAGNVIDITGVGFDSLPGAATVVFTRAGMLTSGDDLFKCSDVQIVSDTELICTAPLLDGSNTTTAPNGGWIIVVTSDDTSASATFQTVVSSGAGYTTAPF